MSIPEIIAHGSSLSVLVPLGFYLARIKRVSRPIHIIGALLLVAAICDVSGFLLFKAQRSTAIVFNVYYTAMFFLLSGFYYDIFFKNRYKVALLMGSAVYVISFILITFYVQQFFYYQNLLWMIAGIIMILYSITCFVNSLSSIPTVHLFNTSTIWINTAILFYFSLSIFLFSMGDYLFNRQDPQVTLLLWSTHNVNNLIKNILFAIAMSLYPKKEVVATSVKQNFVIEQN
jgi:hypothetical protein